MVYECFFNPDVDLQEVDQFGFVNLHAAVINNCIPSDLKVDSLRFNEMDVDEVGNYARDNFAIIDAGRNLNKQMNTSVNQPTEQREGE